MRLEMRYKFRASKLSLIGIAIAFFGGPHVFAQVDTGTILGTVLDQTGATVPGAKVTLTNEGTGLTLSAATSSAGAYIFTPINIGAYMVSVTRSGFQKVVYSHIRVNIQAQVKVDVTLPPGTVTETVNVTSASPLLETQSASVGHVVGAKAINDLPLNGRNYTFLAQLTAGVTRGQPEFRGVNSSGSFSANGTRPQQNNYLLNGMDNNSNAISMTNGTAYVVQPPLDAIEEFKIQTSNYSAEFGRGGGAVLNASIKSGTNQLHGDLWEFLRNDKLDAADFFENANNLAKGEYRRNQFGFTVGGPVYIPKLYNGRNKTFWFVDYEGTRLRQGNPFISTVPTVAERDSGYTDFSDLIAGQSGAEKDIVGRIFPAGTIFDPSTTRPVAAGQSDPVTRLVGNANGYVRDPFYQGSLAGVTNFTPPGAVGLLNRIPSARLDPNAVRLLNLLPLPAKASLFENYASNPVIKSSTNSFDTRVDQDFGDHDRMFAVVSFNDYPASIPGPFPGIADGGSVNQGDQTSIAVNAVLSETHIFSPSTVNEARVGYSRLHWSRPQPFANTMGIPAEYGIAGIPQFPGNGGLPNLNISGLTSFGSSTFKPSERWDETTQFSDNLTKILGRHTIKAGFQFEHLIFPSIGTSAPHGAFSYSGAFTDVPNLNSGNTGRAQFLLTPIISTVPAGVDNVGGATSVSASNISTVDSRRNYYGLYVQDDWQITSKLTLNLGLRWEYFQPIVEHFNAQANFLPAIGFTGAQFLVPEQRQGLVLSEPILNAMAKDNISVVRSSNQSLVNAQSTNFAPRFGLAYQVTNKLVMRAGYGMFYGGFENIGGSPSLGSNYPFQYSLGFSAPSPTLPITGDNSIGLLENGLSNVPLDPASVKPSGISFVGQQSNFRTPYLQRANFMIQVQLTPNQFFEIGYVGSWGRHIQSTLPVNPITRILPPGTNTQTTRAFPDFGPGGSFLTEQGNSNYNSLQATFERRFSNGLSVLTNFTYAKTLTDARDPLFTGNDQGYRAPWLPGFGIQGDYQLANFDIGKAFKFSGTYELPFGPGKRFASGSGGLLSQIVGGWSLNGILTLQDGPPMTIPCSITTVAGSGCYALLVPGQDPYAGPHDVNQWLNPKAFANPAVATVAGQTDFAPLGGHGSQVRAPGLERLDVSTFKQFKISEKTRLEFRAEFFNLPNHPAFAAPGFANFGVPAAPGSLDFTNTRNFGKVTQTLDNPNDPRQIQFGLKLYF